MTFLTVHKPSERQLEIVGKYLSYLDQHMQDIKKGTAERIFGINDFAEKLHIHPIHLSNTLRETLGQSPCGIFEEKLLAIAKELILTTNGSIAHIARHLTYDPSNFSKFFKTYTGITPKQFREMHK
jgi:AraC family transcriptional regulator, regulatory protein of adaptative response / methylphosphotriester-DNA alkyltransferase methyltransferase